MNKQENANKDNNSVLYIAFHYPPIIGSSGVHRTLAFTRYLNEHNWDTTVLTSSLKAYEMWSKEQFDFLQQLGCDHGQGFYMCKPIPFDDFIQLMLEETNYS